MKGYIALLMTFFTLFLSAESSFILHFCHNEFVAAAVNKEISTCCKKKDHLGPVVTGVCCELSSFNTKLNDTVLNDNSISIFFPSCVAIVSDVAEVAVVLKERSQQPITRPPPKRTKRDLHIFYAQYLI
ncbi:MAG: hypothetical protein CMC82_02370 [Flavobacteriaceae bacterium]|nr:hypothetical protein [Flavobacteriaceae bacterium]|tara:strand:+ start:461 stop:847 length:387 start_codon:yes stop_codon:yes gene_type:complete